MVAVLSLAGLAGCGTQTGAAPLAPPCNRAKALDPVPELAADMPLPAGAIVTKVKKNQGFISVHGLVAGEFNAVFGEIEGLIKEQQFQILNLENEGTDAEIYFARYADVAGLMTMKPGPCDGDVTVKIIYDPIEDPNKKTGAISLGRVHA